MPDAGATTVSKRPGRPHKGAMDSPKTRVWFSVLSTRMHKSSGYALEKYFDNDKIHRCDGIVMRPCKYDKYKRGVNTPSTATLQKTEQAFPGSSYWYYHPFWKVAETTTTTIDINELHDLLYQLRPEVSNILFFENERPSLHPRRKQENIFKLLEHLNQESDIDALTACLGVFHEFEYYTPGVIRRFASPILLKIFRRAFSVYPLLVVYNDVFEYLKQEYLRIPDDSQWNKHVKTHDPLQITEWYQLLSGVLEDLHIKPLVCKNFTHLYLADKYLSRNTLIKINRSIFEGCNHDIANLPEMKKLNRHLHRIINKSQ